MRFIGQLLGLWTVVRAMNTLAPCTLPQFNFTSIPRDLRMQRGGRFHVDYAHNNTAAAPLFTFVGGCVFVRRLLALLE